MNILAEFSRNPIEYIIAIILVSALGLFVWWILKIISAPFDEPEQFFTKCEENIDWSNLFDVPSGGWQIGLFERNLFLLGITVGRPEIIFGWLVFKLGAQFQAWGNIVKIPDTLECIDDIEYLMAKKMWADRTYQRFVLGTALNITVAFLVYLLLLYFLNS